MDAIHGSGLMKPRSQRSQRGRWRSYYLPPNDSVIHDSVKWFDSLPAIDSLRFESVQPCPCSLFKARNERHRRLNSLVEAKTLCVIFMRYEDLLDHGSAAQSGCVGAEG